MKDGELFSPYIMELLIRQGERPESVLLSACCDRSLNDSFEDTFVFLSIDKISFLTVKYDAPVQKVYNSFVAKKKDKHALTRENTSCRKKKYVSYKLSEIKELKLVNLVASGIAYINFEDDRPTEVISPYTNACVGDLSKIDRAIQKIKKDGVLNIAEFKDKEDETNCPKCGTPYIDKVRKVCPKCADRKSTFKRLLKMTPKYGKYFFISILCTIMSSVIGLVSPYLSNNIFYDQVLVEDSGFWSGKVWTVVLMVFGIALLSRVVSSVATINMGVLSRNLVYDLKSDIFASVQKMSMGYFVKNRMGNIMSQINTDTGYISNFFISGIPFIIKSVIDFVGSVILVVVLCPNVLWLAIFPVLAIIVGLKFSNKYLRRLSIRAWRVGSSMSSAVSDSLSGVKVVKAFGKEQKEVSRFEKINNKYFKVNFKMTNTYILLTPVYSLVTSLVTYAIWLFVGFDIIGGTGVSYGDMQSTLTYFGMMLAPVLSLSGVMEWWQNCMTAAQRMYDIADAESDVKESKSPIVMDKVKGEIDIKNVTFGYEPNQPILKKMNLHVNPGEMIGIVGHSGAGKSTLINLITRMYDVDDGALYIDGYNVKDIANRTLRDNIALVTQETYIFQGTVLENIAYANPEAKREDVIAAAKIAQCHDFIEAMPEGYDTMVGAGYRQMSGGERQRVSIARAILINPRILILDEATAALDTETEMSIQNALDSLTDGRTTLAIAHRLSTLRNADRLIVIEDGEITEEGTHEELVKAKGIYYNFMLKQAEALKAKGV